ncbi:MAG: FAD-dependent oxidoreductase [Pseudomonadota bacterium]
MNETIITADIAIVGAGMAGASLAAELGDSSRVVLIEGEDQPGYHSTGRSAAFWSETYGGPVVQPLTSASFAYLEENGFLAERGEIHIARAGDIPLVEAMTDAFGDSVRLDRLSGEALAARVPGLRPDFVTGLDEQTCRDIDVAGLHAHYLARARRAGVALLTDARILALEREANEWRIGTRAGEIRAGLVVNAAGAWADDVARLAGAAPIGIQPYRRTMIQLEVDPPAAASLPLVMDAAGGFYFKPEPGGRIWLSPHDETPCAPCDAAPDEIDVATAIDRFEQAVDWRVVRRERAWAGLRSFAPDRAPVYGFDDRVDGFFWFAGQGGFGIQTAPAAALIGAALLLDRPLPDSLRHIDPRVYRPGRFLR